MSEQRSLAKKPYRPPTLRAYGDLRAITRGKHSSRKEVSGTSGKKTRNTTD